MAYVASNFSKFACLPACINKIIVYFLRSNFSPLRSSLLLIGPPELLFDFRRQRVEQVLLHHQAAPLQQATLAELHGETLETVPSQLQLRQPGELSEARRQRLQAVVSQIQSAQLLALEQLRGQSLDLERRG